MASLLDRTFSVAPMMGYTDRFGRYVMRLLTRRALLYTEMTSTGSLLLGPCEELLEYDPVEHPVALQLGGSQPQELATCARLGEQAGYDEINLNVGCPSNRVAQRDFGACLMARPALVAECVAAMREAVSVPVTVKTRIGIDDRDSYSHLVDFVEQVSRAGCRVFAVHARKAWLKGLNPRQNRTVPPLRYDTVYRLKQDFPHLDILINGGIRDWDQGHRHLEQVDGIMVGRQAYDDLYSLASVDARFYAHHDPVPGRLEVVRRLLPYARKELARGTQLARITCHLLGLFHGQPGSRRWRRFLSERACRRGAGIEVLEDALKLAGEVRGAGAPQGSTRGGAA